MEEYMPCLTKYDSNGGSQIIISSATIKNYKKQNTIVNKINVWVGVFGE